MHSIYVWALEGKIACLCRYPILAMIELSYVMDGFLTRYITVLFHSIFFSLNVFLSFILLLFFRTQNFVDQTKNDFGPASLRLSSNDNVNWVLCFEEGKSTTDSKSFVRVLIL